MLNVRANKDRRLWAPTCIQHSFARRASALDHKGQAVQESHSVNGLP